MSACAAELCPNWSGDGNVCPCAVLGLDPPAARCETTELLVTQCGCPKHRGPALADPPTVSHWFPAAFPGRCSGCDGRIEPGDRIGSTDDGYICEDCS